MGTTTETHDQHSHASVKKYWFIFVILGLLTFIEWTAYEYKPIKDSALYVPILVSAMITKFILVCGWYMHLRYDHKILMFYYAASIMIAFLTVVALGILLF